MNRTHRLSSLAIVASLSLASAAIAQQSGGAPPAPTPGTGDASRISNSNREANSDYNHLIGQSGNVTKDSDTDDSAKKKSHAATPATAADITAGAALRDIKGVPVGTVASVDADGVVVDTGETKIKVPLIAFGKDDEGLLLSITADKFHQLIAQAHASN